MSKADKLKAKAVAVYEALPPDSKRFMMQSQDKGASSWVNVRNVIPLEDEGFNVNKEEFFDSFRIIYNLPLPLLPVTCVFSQPNNLTHALQCQEGGFVNRRHDNIIDFLVCLLKEVCINVQAEPHLTNLLLSNLCLKPIFSVSLTSWKQLSTNTPKSFNCVLSFFWFFVRGHFVAQLPWKLSPDECRLKVAYRLSDMGHSACLMAWHGRCCAG